MENLEEKVQKANDFINEVYLYCEDNGIKTGKVKVEIVEYELKMTIDPDVDEGHKEILIRMAEEFEKEQVAE